MLSLFKHDLEQPALPLSGRRERPIDAGSAMVAAALTTKLLHGWLQNRHQTLVPLSLNLRVLAAEQRETVIDGVAALLLAGRPRADAIEAFAPIRQWLGSLGADEMALAQLNASVDASPPLDGVFERAAALDLAVYLYVAAVVASDARYPASALLADVVQARFELSTAVVRSAVRRYRR